LNFAEKSKILAGYRSEK